MVPAGLPIHEKYGEVDAMKIEERPRKMNAATVLAMQLLADAGRIRVKKAANCTPIVNQQDYDFWISKLTAAPANYRRS